jgi:hypothetical protein
MAEHSDIRTGRCSFSEILYVYLTIFAKYLHTVFVVVRLERISSSTSDQRGGPERGQSTGIRRVSQRLP